MKYFCLDVETTGRDCHKDDLLEISIIYDDLRDQRSIDVLPRFHCYIVKERYFGEPGALRMHPKIFNMIEQRVKGYNYYPPMTAWFQLVEWFQETCKDVDWENHKINIAGKNVVFDIGFLTRLPNIEMQGTSLVIKRGTGQSSIVSRARVIDPAMIYTNPWKDDALPNLMECYGRMNKEEEEKEAPHTAYEDNIITVKLLRHWANKLKLMEQVTKAN